MEIFREIHVCWWMLSDPMRYSHYEYYIDIGLKQKYAYEKAKQYGK